MPGKRAATRPKIRRPNPLDERAICRYVVGMDNMGGQMNVIGAKAAAMPSFDAFWFSFSYYACPALLEGGEST